MVNKLVTWTMPDFGRWKPWRRDLTLALLAAAAAVLLQALKGFPTLADSRGDNDSVMRMVEVLDLLSGQGWFDLHQYRMGPPGGFIMHWSRFIDAPIAAIILLVRGLTGSLAAGEAAASILWPALLMTAALFLIARLVRRFGGDAAAMPGLLIGAVTLNLMPLFQTNALDHHNAQLVLALATIAFLLASSSRPLAGAGAGLTTALSLVVGMETVPYVAVAGLVAAMGFLFGGRNERLAAAAFGLAFASVALVSFLGTIPPALWGAPRCDAFTSPQMSIALLSGTGLAAIALAPVGRESGGMRLLLLLALGAAVAALLVIAFPECLASPYAGLDPRLKLYWLDSVEEAQPFLALAEKQPSAAVYYYATPFLATAVMALGIVRRGFRRDDLIFAAFLLAAVLTSLWQVRGSFFALPFAVVPLAAWVAEWRARAAERPKLSASLKLAAVWLLSFSLVWGETAAAASLLLEKGGGADDDLSAGCYGAADYDTLARLPKGTVLAISNIGSSILRYTPHRVLAGPYHRNVEGDVATLDAFTSTPDKAHAIIRRYGVTIVASCPGNGETPDLAALAPDGLMAALSGGRIPSWLAPVPEPAGRSLKLFRVVETR